MNIEQLIFATTAMIVATAIAIGVAKKLSLGSMVALLLVGMALGPHSPRPLLVGHAEELQAVGEIGVMLLLLVVGLDIQPSRLWSMRRLVLSKAGVSMALGAFMIGVLLSTTVFADQVKAAATVPFLAQRDELRRLGAIQVMALVPEGTLSFGRSVLDSLGIPAGEASAIIGSLHANDYAVLRGIGGIETAAIDASAATPGTWR